MIYVVLEAGEFIYAKPFQTGGMEVSLPYPLAFTHANE